MKKAARKARETLERANGPKPILTPRTFGEKLKVAKQRRDESRYHKGSCAMRLVAGDDELMDGKPGDFYWDFETSNIQGEPRTYRVMWARWPDGCVACLPIEGTGDTRKPSWKWDGNLARPTLAPSIHHIGHWHGYVLAGRMVSV